MRLLGEGEKEEDWRSEAPLPPTPNPRPPRGSADLRGTALILKWGLAQLERLCLIRMQGAGLDGTYGVYVCVCVWVPTVASICCSWQPTAAGTEGRGLCCSDVHLLSHISKVINFHRASALSDKHKQDVSSMNILNGLKVDPLGKIIKEY